MDLKAGRASITKSRYYGASTTGGRRLASLSLPPDTSRTMEMPL